MPFTRAGAVRELFRALLRERSWDLNEYVHRITRARVRANGASRWM